MLKVFAAALAGLALSTAASAQEPVEGQDYTLLETPVATVADDANIEVTEVFWFGCPHCYALQESVDAWYSTLEDDVEVVKMPATMGGNWNTHANAFYAAQSLGIEQALHEDFFDAIHQDGQSLTDEDDIVAFFTEYGVSEEEARNALNSFEVRSETNRAHGRMREMRLMGVPALVVDGRYVITPSTAGGLDNMPVIAEALIEQVRSERAE